jgi:signal transduction histidine kinase
LDGVATATAKLPALVAGRQHPIPSDRIAEEQQAIDSKVRMMQSFQDSIHAMQASTLAINQAAELAVRDPARINTAAVAAILAEEQQAIYSPVRMGQFLQDSIHAMRASTRAIIQAAELAASDPTRNNDIPEGGLASLQRRPKTPSGLASLRPPL